MANTGQPARNVRRTARRQPSDASPLILIEEHGFVITVNGAAG